MSQVVVRARMTEQKHALFEGNSWLQNNANLGEVLDFHPLRLVFRSQQFLERRE